MLELDHWNSGRGRLARDFLVPGLGSTSTRRHVRRTVFFVRGSCPRNHSVPSPFIGFQPDARGNRYTSDALNPESVIALTNGSLSCLRIASNSAVELHRP